MKLSIQDLMNRSGVGFGTSGARGLATAMTDRVCYAYTCGFLQHLEICRELLPHGQNVAMAGDLRPSTGRIIEAVRRAIADRGHLPVSCGRIPSPALALAGIDRGIPAIMVTGSHIPDDRNGIKFNKASGEILKEDEHGIAGQVVELDDTLFDADGAFKRPEPKPLSDAPEAGENYLARYLDFFGPGALEGLRVGVYEHSAVGRDMLVTALSRLGAQTVAFGRSDAFLPVDTEAIRPEDVQLALEWARQGRFDAIVSTDGDSDRPLVSDERGRWLRGDVAGILCAKFLEADTVCTPVSCNTAVEKSGWFRQIRRTRIGSPYVIAAMIQARERGARRVVGYEANGGFLTASEIEREGRRLRALPTRDALIVILSLLVGARQQRRRVSDLVASLPPRFTASDRLKNFASDKSGKILARFSSGDDGADRAALERAFGAISGQVAALDRTDGLRVTFTNEEIIHLRPSGNAPEFRCYSEADTEERAREITAHVLDLIGQLG